MNNTELDKIPFSALKQLVEQIEKQPHLADRLNEVEISFEFLIGSLFPSIWNNIHDTLQQEHTKGYAEGIGANFNIEQLYEHLCDTENKLYWSDLAFPKYCPICGKKLREDFINEN